MKKATKNSMIAGAIILGIVGPFLFGIPLGKSLGWGPQLGLLSLPLGAVVGALVGALVGLLVRLPLREPSEAGLPEMEAQPRTPRRKKSRVGKAPPMSDVEVRRRIWELVGPASFKITCEVEDLLEFGPEDQVVRALISLVKNPRSDHDVGVTNAMALAQSLGEFAERGNKEAVAFFVDIASGRTTFQYSHVLKAEDPLLNNVEPFIRRRSKYFSEQK